MSTKIDEEKRRALAEFRADVLGGRFPNDAECVGAEDSEVERFRELLEP